MATNISTITIHASPQRVWEVITDPQLVKDWQFGSDLMTDWEPGSRIEFVTKWEDKVFRQWGTILSFHPPISLSYSLFAPRPGLEDSPENYFTMQYKLSASGEATTLEIIQEDNRPGAKQEEPQGEENPVLQNLKQLAERH